VGILTTVLRTEEAPWWVTVPVLSPEEAPWWVLFFLL